MDLVQKEPNSIFYTQSKIKCCQCKKTINYSFDIMDKGIWCPKCFCKHEHFIFGNKEYIGIRVIISKPPDKVTRKTERGVMSFKVRYQILKRDNFKCVLCGHNDRLEIDHIIPVSKGGKSINSNLRTLCFKCNRGKSDE